MSHARSFLIVAVLGAIGCGRDASTAVEQNAPLTVTPTSLSLGVGTSQPVQITLVGQAVTPTSTRIADSCVARVTPSGVVTGVGPGTTTLLMTLAARGQQWNASIPVTVSELATLRLTFQSITTGSPPVAVDPNALRGTVTAVVNADPSMYASVELRLANRPVDTRALTGNGVDGIEPVAFTLNTGAKDASGSPLYPNGVQTLEALGTRRPPAPGCPASVDRITQQVAIANP